MAAGAPAWARRSGSSATSRRGESVGRIDWRRSARDDHTYVREREWEAAQTIWLWIDRSPSMAFVSDLGLQSKLDRALVLGLAAADLLVRGGERVGLLGLTRPLAARNVVDRFAEALIADAAPLAELPPPEPLPGRSRALVISDLLSDADEVVGRIAIWGSAGARGHLVAVCDPVEESFPFAGHIEFSDVDSAAKLRLGEAAALRDRYLTKLAEHRGRIDAACRRQGWTFAIHRTDRPATEALLRLATLLGDDAAGGRGLSMPGLPLAFAIPAVLGALVLLPALYFLLRVTPPKPREVPFPPLRLILDQRPERETPARTPPWLLLLRLAIAAAIILAMAGPIWNPPPRTLVGEGPLLLAIDDGFAAAPDWAARGRGRDREGFGSRARGPPRGASRPVGGSSGRAGHDGRGGTRPVAGAETRSVPSRPLARAAGARRFRQAASRCRSRLDR